MEERIQLSEALDWYGEQMRVDANARSESEGLLGPEGAIFAEAMAQIAECLDYAIALGPIDDLRTKRRVALVTHTFNLIWASWNEALTGRYDVAVSHFRSIEEAPDFLMALDANPGLADAMGRAPIEIETAWRALRKDLDKLEDGKGKQWFTWRQERAKGTQPLAHVSPEVTNQSLAIRIEDNKKIGTLRLGGVVSGLNLRPLAMTIAGSAVTFLAAVVVAFHTTPSVYHLWTSRGLEFVEQSLAVLGEQLETMNAPTGEVEFIEFKPSRTTFGGE